MIRYLWKLPVRSLPDEIYRFKICRSDPGRLPVYSLQNVGQKLAALEKLYQESLTRYQNEGCGQHWSVMRKPEDAALTLVASALLNWMNR